MSNAILKIFEEEKALEKKTSKAARVIFESDFGPDASNKVEELIRKFNPPGASAGQKKIMVRMTEDPNRLLSWAVAQRVRMERERQGLRQEDLAERAGIKRPNIARIEKGKHLPSVSTLQKVARALNLHMGTLMAVPAPSAEDMLEFKELAEEGIQEWSEALEKEDRRA